MKNKQPQRITDLIDIVKNGAELTCATDFEIVPVNFAHRNETFQAYIFLCRYSGTVDDREYMFRKCYARGCPHNLCPHVSQAVMIANRYLQRDYARLKNSGIEMEEQLFSLENMMVKYENMDQDKNASHGGILTLQDYINIAKEGNSVSIEMDLEFVPAVEHFASHENAQTFLMGNFTITTLGKTSCFQRCLACFPTENSNSNKEKDLAVDTANERLKLLFMEFNDTGVQYNALLFDTSF
ncbi:MAG: hypothetical protein R6V54_06415 [Desulfobacteraceae bacterium]